MATHAWYAWAVTALVVVCATIIVITGNDVPEALWGIAFATGGGAAGLSIPAATTPRKRVVRE